MSKLVTNNITGNRFSSLINNALLVDFTYFAFNIILAHHFCYSRNFESHVDHNAA